MTAQQDLTDLLPDDPFVEDGGGGMECFFCAGDLTVWSFWLTSAGLNAGEHELDCPWMIGREFAGLTVGKNVYVTRLP